MECLHLQPNLSLLCTVFPECQGLWPESRHSNSALQVLRYTAIVIAFLFIVFHVQAATFIID